MSSRVSHRSSVARHVYLRTQQHRLRHVKSIVIRNFTPSDVNFDLFRDPLAITTYFTLHSTHYPEKVLYKSDPVLESYNPSWEAVQFEPQEYEKYSALPSFILKLWVRGGQENETLLGLEKIVELSSLVYLGTLLNKDGSGYPPNSIIVGMFEGYYSHPAVGGVPCPPRITHGLEKLLPPQSMLEVHKTEVQDSYLHHVLLRLLNRQEMLNKTTAGAKLAHDQVESHVKVEDTYFQKRSERELLKMRVAILRRQLADKDKDEVDERRQLCKLQAKLDTQENTLTEGLADLKLHKERFEVDIEEFCKKKEMLRKAKRHQLLRQRNMICEAASTFFILEKRDKFTICNVILQNADQLDQPSSVEQPGVALGYVAQLVHHLAKILLVPLQYEIRPNGSRSHVCDYISDEAIIDNIREFPLFLKGSERALFYYAVHLLNKNIAQVRQHCGYGTSKTMQKKTLPNLKLLLDRIIKELSMNPSTPTTSRQDSSPFTPAITPTDLTVAVSPMAVPQVRDRKTRERGGTTSSIALTPPSRNSFSTEQETYSSSPSSPMSFQQSDDAGGVSRSLSPLQLPRSQDDTSTESNERSFQSRFQFPSRHEQTLPVTAVTLATSSSQYNATSQQYPAMQNDVQGRHYPMPIRNGSQGHPFPVLSPVLSITEDLPSSPLPQDRVIQEAKRELTPERSLSPDHENTITSQSYAHADLHRSKLAVSPDHAVDEEMASGGMMVDNNRSSLLDSSSNLRIRSNPFVDTSVLPTASTKFVVGVEALVDQSSKTSDSNGLNNHRVNQSGTEGQSSENELDEEMNGQQMQESIDWHTNSKVTDVQVNTQLPLNTPNSSDDQHQDPYKCQMHSTLHNAPNNHQVSLNASMATTTHTASSTSLPFHDQVAASPSRKSETVSFQHTLLETGYIKTDVATPHMVVRTKDTGHRQTSPFTSGQLFNKPVSTNVSQVSVNVSGTRKNASGSQMDNQAELLEDFIDGF